MMVVETFIVSIKKTLSLSVEILNAGILFYLKLALSISSVDKKMIPFLLQ